MQRKYGNASRSPASYSYKKLQKRIMYHKQQLQELEQAKKVFQTSSQVWSYFCYTIIRMNKRKAKKILMDFTGMGQSFVAHSLVF